MNKQTIQFNGQDWEEIDRNEYLGLIKQDRPRLLIQSKGLITEVDEIHYYRLVPPPETFPKIFGRYCVNNEGSIFFNNDESHGWITINDNDDIPNLKLALAESERIRSTK